MQEKKASVSMDLWYVAKAKPSKEQLLLSTLSSLDIETFFPMIRNPRLKRAQIEPLFPGYVFCRAADASTSWSRVKWAVGLSYFLGAEGRPAEVPDTVVQFLREQTQRWNQDAGASGFTSGERVWISEGPFAGLMGIFQRYLPSQKRCQILLELLGGMKMVEMDASAVNSISAVNPLNA